MKPKIFYDGVIAGVTERNPKFPPFGLTFTTSSNARPSLVKHYYNLLGKYLGIDPKRIWTVHQVHSDKVHIADSNYKTKYGDALITKEKNCLIGVKIADCAGILIYDPVVEVVSAVHSGWRGTFKRILPKTILKIHELFGSKIENLLVYISPLASVENYEVGEEFVEFFSNSVVNRDGRYFFDNRKELLNQLISLGVPPENIEVSTLCTIENKNLHSYRRDGNGRGNMLAFIGMKE